MAATPDIPPDTTPLLDTEPTNTPDKFSYKSASFDEVLEDLSSRFILNLPEDELAEIERVCFQVEQAHWYYEDFIREENTSFPSLPLKRFSEILFRSCPLLHHWSHDHETAFNGFMSYKTRVPVCGAIMLNEALTKCVLVKGWKSSAGWGFPKGKVNENEDEAFCAVREVLEETGYSLSGQIRRTDCIRLRIKQQPITLFVVAGVPEDFPFKTQTRKEISKIDWFKLADLPTWKKNRSGANKFYLITPVIDPLKGIVRNLRKARRVTRTVQDTQTISIPAGTSNEIEVDDAGATVPLEALTAIENEPSSHSQSGEAELSSSQSSSIDPHTPSVHGDLAPHTSDDTIIVKHDFPNGMGESDESLDALSSGFNADPRAHWSRLMTRLNHSEESSPQGTPQSLTPTPPLTINSTRRENHPPDSSSPRVAPVGMSSSSSESSGLTLNGLSRRHSSMSRSSSMPVQPKPDSSSPDVLVKRTRQLQLLESVVAEETARRTPQPTPPMSAHILGAYPRSTNELVVPDHARAPNRSVSVNPEGPRRLFAPFHHKHSVSSVSGVLPSPTATSLQHRPVNSAHGHYSLYQHGPTSRPASTHFAPQASLPSSHLPNSPLGASSFGGNAAVDTVHRGQMLSILSGGAVRPPARESRSTSAPRNGNAHLLSILNNAPRVS